MARKDFQANLARPSRVRTTLGRQPVFTKDCRGGSVQEGHSENLLSWSFEVFAEAVRMLPVHWSGDLPHGTSQCHVRFVRLAARIINTAAIHILIPTFQGEARSKYAKLASPQLETLQPNASKATSEPEAFTLQVCQLTTPNCAMFVYSFNFFPRLRLSAVIFAAQIR